MLITFEHALILSVRSGTSQKGTPYCGVQFFDADDSAVYDLAFFGDDVKKVGGLQPKSNVALTFELSPSSRGGVRLLPAW